MKVKTGKEVIRDSSKRGSDVIKGVAGALDEAEYRTKIDELIHERGISQRQLSEITGIQLSYLSDFILGKTSTINKTHLLALMAVLRVDSIEDIIEIRLPDKIKKEFEEDREDWISTQTIPEGVAKLAHKATAIRLLQ